MFGLLDKLLAIGIIILGVLLLLFSGWVRRIAVVLGVISLILLVSGMGWFWFIGIIVAAILFWFKKAAKWIFRVIGLIIILVGVVMLVT